MSSLTIIIAVFLVYLALLVVLTVWSSRESRTVEGYYIAGKRLPYWVVAFSTNATGESGWLILGLTGMGYAVGLHAMWVVIGEIIGVSLAWLVVARRLRRDTGTFNSITLPDYLESRFNDASHLLRFISVSVIVLMVITYIAAQLVATGKAFSDFMNTGYAWGVVIGAAITFAYTAAGGFKAVCYTDVFQGVLMLIGLVVLPATAWHAAGGWDGIGNGLAQIDPGLMSWYGPHGRSARGIVAIASFLAIGLPFMGVPQLLVRYMSIRSEAEVRTAAAISIACLFVFTFGAVITGMAGRVLFPHLADPELIMPTLSHALFSPLMTGFLVVVLLAAIMSTVDSLFILASSAVTRDLVQRVFRPDMADASVARLGQVVTVIIGIIGMLIALSQNRMIFWFVLFSWSGLGATFGPVILCCLYWKGTTRAGAAAGMLGGFVTTVGWVLLLKTWSLGLYELIPGFIAGLLFTILISRITRAEKSQNDVRNDAALPP